MLGIGQSPVSDQIHNFISNAVITVDSGAFLSARWGSLNVMQTYDPVNLAPINDKSWVLDLDLFLEEVTSFDPSAIVLKSTAFSEKIYTFFRWAVTDEFLRIYGGAV
jgi:uncharacterized protein (TIGR04255 family)